MAPPAYASSLACQTQQSHRRTQLLALKQQQLQWQQQQLVVVVMLRCVLRVRMLSLLLLLPGRLRSRPAP
jgi:invasion protein IalB